MFKRVLGRHTHMHRCALAFASFAPRTTRELCPPRLPQRTSMLVRFPIASSLQGLAFRPTWARPASEWFDIEWLTTLALLTASRTNVHGLSSTSLCRRHSLIVNCLARYHALCLKFRACASRTCMLLRK